MGFWCHFLAPQSGVSRSQALSAKSGVLKKKIKNHSLWECDGFDVLRLSNTLKAQRQKNVKKKLYLDISGQNSVKTLYIF